MIHIFLLLLKSIGSRTRCGHLQIDEGEEEEEERDFLGQEQEEGSSFFPFQSFLSVPSAGERESKVGGVGASPPSSAIC